MAYSQDAAMWYGIQAQQAQVRDHHGAYKRKPAMGCGITQIILGLTMLATNIASISIYNNGMSYVGHGIWSGVLLIITGSFTITAGERKGKCFKTTSMIMSIFSAIACGAAVGLSGAGIAFNSGYYNSGYVHSPGMAVESIILVAALAAGIMSIIVSTACCSNMSNRPPPTSLKAIKTLENYPQISSLTIGILQIVSGITSFGLGIAAITTHAMTAGPTGVGIWCGAMFFAHGVSACTSAAGRKTFCKTRAQTVLAYVTGLFALAQMGIAGNGVYNEFWILHRDSQYDHYTNRIPTQSEADMLISRSVISGMLLMFAIISGFCCFWGTIFGCRGLCKCCCATPSLEKQIYMPVFTSKCFGTAQVTIGILSIGLGTASVSAHSYMGFHGAGIAGICCGVMYVIAGSFGYLAGVKKIKSLTVAAMVLSLVCIPFVLTQLGLSAGSLGSFYYYNECYNYRYDYERERCYSIFKHLKDSKQAMDALLLIMAVAEGICLIVTATVACKCKPRCACCSKGNSCVGCASANPYVLPPEQPPVMTQPSVTTQPPPSFAAATQPPAPGMAPPAVFMYQNGALVPVPVVFPAINTTCIQPSTITTTTQAPQATVYPQMLGVVNPAVNPQYPDTGDLLRTTGEEEKDGPPGTPPQSDRSSSDLSAAVHNPIYE